MTTRSHTPVLALALTLALAALSASGEERPAAPGPNAAPAAADPFAGACVDCHLNFPERGLDVRLSTLLAGYRDGRVRPETLEKARSATPGQQLAGRHPEVTGSLGSIPESCRSCHRENAASAPDLARLIHLIHLTGGAENHYLAEFRGECTTCHKLDPATGVWRVPSAPERK